MFSVAAYLSLIRLEKAIRRPASASLSSNVDSALCAELCDYAIAFWSSGEVTQGLGQCSGATALEDPDSL
jgi:hypothetical protein